MITKQVFKDRAEWLVYRSAEFVVGSSNIGTILGLNKHKTPLQLWTEWREKTDKPTESQMFRGQFMEDGIAQWFEQETGRKVIKRSSEIAVFRNDKYAPFIQVAPDREVFAEELSSRPILEIKDTSMYVDFEDLSTIPDEWFAQIQLQMAVMERKYAYLAINDGSKQMKVRLFEYDSEYAVNIIAMATEWVQKHIIGGIRPDPINGDDVMALFPHSENGIIKVEKSLFDAVEQARVYKSLIKEYESKFSALKSQIQATFDERDTIEFEGRKIATFKTCTQSGFDSAKFREDHPDLYEQYKTNKQYRKLMM